MISRGWIICLGGVVALGCATDGRLRMADSNVPKSEAVSVAAPATAIEPGSAEELATASDTSVVRLVSARSESTDLDAPAVSGSNATPENPADPRATDNDGSVQSTAPPLQPALPAAVEITSGLPLQDVVGSVQSYFPTVQVAYLERDRTSGDQLAAWGEFDTKLKARSESQPLGYYENYQNAAGVNQPLYRGGEVYSGYRIGRGVFEPWYGERQTNEGGEFKAGFQLPLLRDREIDARRAELWRATYDRQLAEPRIRSAVIETIRDATIAYWVWVAAGNQVQIGESALQLAERRNRQVARRVEEGDLGDPDLADNQRAIMQRQGKLIDLTRKRTQTAAKLSLFLRDGMSEPRIPSDNELPNFPEVVPYELSQLNADIQYAARMRPELTALNTEYRRVQVDYAEACNQTLPVLDAFSNVSQDVGEPTSSKRDKSELELELGFEFEMPVQRRKGFGKMRSARAKLNQITVKRDFTIEKIAVEVQTAVAAIDAAYRRVNQIADAVQISNNLAQIERRKFELGESDLLAVFLREQIAIEAASDLVDAKLEYFVARAYYTAALAYEFPVTF
ncbi:TolC family protein [Aporhodopirellula aestuarii]|uniref:TolC family protein n=1 Tax=Aporhodopirellula aestuarii TaxID=2950107 RepID=A0ABT0TZY8_9BACT|nr:TolC family protein [Aporhodopirellula aestuarii]MCM2370155.1 TolC family protein [Aporhodopirellula aestuarii]